MYVHRHSTTHIKYLYILFYIPQWYVKNGFSSGIVHEFCMTFNLPFTKQDLFKFYSAMFMKYTNPGQSTYIRN